MIYFTGNIIIEFWYFAFLLKSQQERGMGDIIHAAEVNLKSLDSERNLQKLWDRGTYPSGFT